MHVAAWPAGHAQTESVQVGHDIDDRVKMLGTPHPGALADERKSSHEMVQVGKSFGFERHIALCHRFVAGAR